MAEPMRAAATRTPDAIGVAPFEAFLSAAAHDEQRSRILAIDPGSTRSAYVLLEGGVPRRAAIVPNEELLATLWSYSMPTATVVIEWVQSYGMAVGAEVFDTCRWVGRFAEAAYHQNRRVEYIARTTVKARLCNNVRAKDPNVRQALKDRFGGPAAIGRKASPGPLYQIHGDAWAALAVAVTWADTEGAER